MGHGFKHGGGSGGAALNFKVVGNPQPETAKENTIWVDTDTKITGWLFSAAQPEAPGEGMVWFAVGTANHVAFNALKKNGVNVYPLYAKQYLGGEWVSKTAKSYQGGVWTDWWDGKLYSHGNECLNMTGGWESRHDSTWYGKGTATKKADRITLSGAADTISLIKPVNPIDLTSFSTIIVSLENLTRSTIHVSVVNVGMPFVSANFVADTVETIASAAEATVSLDISGLSSGEYEFCVTSAGASNGSHAADIVEVLLQ